MTLISKIGVNIIAISLLGNKFQAFQKAYKVSNQRRYWMSGNVWENGNLSEFHLKQMRLTKLSLKQIRFLK